MLLSDAQSRPGRTAPRRAHSAALPRRRVLALIGLSLATLSLAGCGYRPLHGDSPENTQVSSELAQVRIGLITNRAGHRLRNHLLDRMNPRGEPSAPSYELSVNLDETRVDLGVRRDETRTRANLTLTATFQLRDMVNSRILFNATARRVASFNIRDAEFSTISAESAARRRTVEGLGDEITQRVAIFLNRKRTKKR
ncbi:MAG TPA: LPS assembly lipoprotein LptE [Alphaproteobacteria bacterium]|nr:LPS assembly lipoprotein LptE [Alphaproteobacteria bacterium]